MSDGDAVERSLDERYSKSALLVLGMHRSGTSAIAGALRLCGAWVGEETELTGTNVENPHGFWERRDMRQICDRLLHTAGADWWKVASFDPVAIPHAILAEQRREFGKVISALDEHETWVVKEPRLCLLLPVLRDYITDPVCIYIFRNPLEVARSLQMRNGFGIAAGLALWEVYNRRALSASENLPCVLVSHQSLMLHPVETLDGLVKRLDELAVTNLVRPDEGRLKQFINPSLYRRRATEEETEEYLSPSQRILWQQFRSNHIFDHDRSALISRTTRQYLFDLESAEQSLNHHKDRRLELSDELAKRVATVEARDGTIRGLKSRTEELSDELAKRVATVEARDGTIRGLKSRTEELSDELAKRVATVEARDGTIRGLKSRTEELSDELAKRVATVEARDGTIRGLKSRTEELSDELAKRVATVEARDGTIRGLKSRTEELSDELAKRVATVEARDGTIRGLKSRTEELSAELAKRAATLEARDGTIRGLKSRTEELSAELAKRAATLEARDGTIRGLKSRTEELSAELAKRAATLEARDGTIRGLKSRTEELSAELAKRAATLEARDGTIRGLKSRTEELSAELAKRAATLEARDATVRGLKSRTEELSAELAKRAATVEARDNRINNIYNSTSWKVTAPFREISKKCRWFLRNIRRVFLLMYWLSTGQFPRAIRAAFPYYKKFAPHNLEKLIPTRFRKYAQLALSLPNIQSPDNSNKISFPEVKRNIQAAEVSFLDGNLSDSLVRWQELLTQFTDDEALSGKAKLMTSVISRLSDMQRYKELISYYSELSAKFRLSGTEMRTVVFTAITDNYDSIKLPERLNHKCDYILFTDSPTTDTGIWQVRPITYLHSDKVRSARFVKTHPHIFLNDYDIAVWIDSNIMILNDIYYIIERFLSSGKNIGAIPHPSRESIYEEITVCISKEKDETDIMKEQIEKYNGKCFSHHDLIESNFMIFDLRDKKLSGFLDSWWREIDCHSRRDQLSLNYALSETGLDWYRLTKRPDSIRNHPDFAFVSHDNGIGPNTKLIDALQAEKIDPYNGPSYAEVKPSRLRDHQTRTVDIIVCVHNALDDVRCCLESISETRNAGRHKLIIVDDGSESPTAEYLNHFSDVMPYCELYRNDVAQGYSKAANRGLAASTGELVILLNSDTIVTHDWVGKLSDAVFSTPGAGIVGPLSNAASYQSIPEYRGSGSQTAINRLASDLTPEDMNLYCERWTTAHILPRVPLIHGFCFCITRQLIDQIGYFDEENFPRGYGEENDYCFRATDAGFGLVVATHTYIFHAKSKSYTDRERVPLMKAASQTFRRIHGHSRVKRAERSMAENPILVTLRARANSLE